MKITLVDLHGSIADAAQSLGWSDISIAPWTDIKDVPREPGSAFVSPANSLGFMDGGIDYVLSRVMFPGVEARVKSAFKSKGNVNRLGRFYLPIGKAVAVETQLPGVFLIAAPTMWLPQDVRGTQNAYHAMYAILEAARRRPDIQHLYLCGLCTGCGMMAPAEAVSQMHAAYTDFMQARPRRYSPEEIVAQQPDVFMNTEFKDIPIEALLSRRDL